MSLDYEHLGNAAADAAGLPREQLLRPSRLYLRERAIAAWVLARPHGGPVLCWEEVAVCLGLSHHSVAIRAARAAPRFYEPRELAAARARFLAAVRGGHPRPLPTSEDRLARAKFYAWVTFGVDPSEIVRGRRTARRTAARVCLAAAARAAFPGFSWPRLAADTGVPHPSLIHLCGLFADRRDRPVREDVRGLGDPRTYGQVAAAMAGLVIEPGAPA